MNFFFEFLVAQNMNFNDPFIIQLKIGTALKNVPVMVKDVPAGALQKIGLTNQTQTQSSPTVLRLVQQMSSKSGSSFQAVPVTNGSSPIVINALSPPAGQSTTASRPGITVSALPSSPKIVIGQRRSFVITSSNISGIIRAHTQLQPHLAAAAVSAGHTVTPLSTIALSPIRPKITVQEAAPRSSPVVCVFDPNKG